MNYESEEQYQEEMNAQAVQDAEMEALEAEGQMEQDRIAEEIENDNRYIDQLRDEIEGLREQIDDRLAKIYEIQTH